MDDRRGNGRSLRFLHCEDDARFQRRALRWMLSDLWLPEERFLPRPTKPTKQLVRELAGLRTRLRDKATDDDEQRAEGLVRRLAKRSLADPPDRQALDALADDFRQRPTTYWERSSWLFGRPDVWHGDAEAVRGVFIALAR